MLAFIRVQFLVFKLQIMKTLESERNVLILYYK